MAEEQTFGPVGGAPHGGMVVGSVVFVVQADGTAVRAGIEQARQIVQQIAPQIQSQLNLSPRVDTTQLRRDLVSAEQQARQSSERIRQDLSQASIGGATTPLLSRQAGLLVPPDTLAFKRSTSEAVASLRSVATAGDTATSSLRQAFTAAGQQIESVGASISRSWSSGFTGIATGFLAFESAERVLGTIIEQGQQANQAAFSLGRSFGDAAPQARAFAESLSGPLGISITQLQTAEAELQRIGRTVGLSVSQVQQLVVLSANLAAVSGRSQEQAAHAIAAAFIGQPRGLDLLGLPATNQVLRASAELDDAQKRHVSQLDLATKSQALFNLLTTEAIPLQGAAAQRARDSAGAFDRLGAASNNLAASIGSGETPLVRLAQGLASVVDFTASANRNFGVLNSILAETMPLLGAVAAIGEMAANIGPPSAGGRFVGGRFPTGRPPLADVTADQAEAERHRAVAAAQRAAEAPTDTLIDRMAQEQAAQQIRTEAIKIYADEASKAGDAASRFADSLNRVKQADADEATRHRAIGAALRDRTVTQLQLNEALRAGLLLAQGAANLGQAGDVFSRHIAPPFVGVAESALNANQDVRDQIRAALAGATPAQRDALARQLAGLAPNVAGIEADVNADPGQQARDRIRAVQDAEQRANSARKEMEREHEADVRRFEDARLSAIRDRETADLRSISLTEDAERRRYDAAKRQIADERDAQLAVLDDQLKILDAQDQARSRSREDTNEQRSFAEAQRSLAEARSAPVGAAGMTPDQRRAIRDAQKQVTDAQQALSDTQQQRASEDQRAGIRAAQERIRKEADAAAKAEDQRDREALDRLRASADDLRTAAEARLKAADAEITAAREQRQTIQAWADIGLRPPGASPVAGAASLPLAPEPALVAAPSAGGTGGAAGTITNVSFDFSGATFGAGVSMEQIQTTVTDAMKRGLQAA